jgi:aspartyl-tRNA(Asn)/glutamyl-tRNA(Gln) amidotransferase subunit B
VPLYDLAYPKDAQKSIAKPGKVVKLTRIHLEEDVAKSTHHDKFTTIDFNRAGTPLMEIVSDPDIDSAEEAFAYLTSLRQILIYGGVSDADMEKGNLRCDVNISVRPEGQNELGAKIELKNLNSMSAVRRAIKFETERQIDCLWIAAKNSSKAPAAGMMIAARPRSCARRKTRTTTATSPIPICSRSAPPISSPR